MRAIEWRLSSIVDGRGDMGNVSPSSAVAVRAEPEPSRDVSVAGGRIRRPHAEVSEEWELEARCRDEDAGLFFGPNGFEPKRERLAREAAAKAICRGCPSLRACREYAITHAEFYGVWGGLGEADRRELIERRGGVATAV
jgi:WhiB family transcriptional regulator, redox-sensing transcriptional regulator